ncbi:hypothetical protein GB931_07865 [Modestobacter sp. I12A-02628]|uniref:Uncharacterized protein n=1 Tax=Goekera deserti TaxID=2497753 RepID=A0A7K3WFJ0_9ACTN|nr:hypothetical protein [Goekera deserti]MPQ97840.1 hypothetical protein [Goekera deserti]NDI48485.1 hypothetical protein [Goekera deserti]NEL55136.1 hypothetical protein [Goekera deserti]
MPADASPPVAPGAGRPAAPAGGRSLLLSWFAVVVAVIGLLPVLGFAWISWAFSYGVPDGAGGWAVVVAGVLLPCAVAAGSVLLLAASSWLGLALASGATALCIVAVALSPGVVTGGVLVTGLPAASGAVLACLPAVRARVRERTSRRRSTALRARVLATAVLVAGGVLVPLVATGRDGLTYGEASRIEVDVREQLAALPGVVGAQARCSRDRDGAALHGGLQVQPGTDLEEVADQAEQILWAGSTTEIGELTVTVDEAFDPAVPVDPAAPYVDPPGIQRVYGSAGAPASGQDRRPLAQLEERYGPRRG